MSDYPDDLVYSREHEWARIKDGVAVVGITQFAVEQLGDVTQVELPDEGDEVSKDEVFGTVESVKAVSDLFAPLSGKVVRVNTPLNDAPEMVNEAPYEEGWMVAIELSNPDEVGELMSPDAYSDFVADQD